MAGAIGPRLGKHRVPASFSNDELLALVGYRSALRQYHEAADDERRAVSEARSRVALNQASAASAASVDALSAALATLNAVLKGG